MKLYEKMNSGVYVIAEMSATMQEKLRMHSKSLRRRQKPVRIV